MSLSQSAPNDNDWFLGNSLERIKAYVDIDQEPQPVESRKPAAYWPSSGSIRVENLSARYSSSGPEVLRDLSFEIKSDECVGVGKRDGRLLYVRGSLR